MRYITLFPVVFINMHPQLEPKRIRRVPVKILFFPEYQENKDVNPSISVNWNSVVTSMRNSTPLLQALRRTTRRRTSVRIVHVSRRTKNRNFVYHSSPSEFRTRHPVQDWRSPRAFGAACQPASGRFCARRYPWKTADGAAVMYILNERCDDSDPRIPPARFRSLRPAGPERRDARRLCTCVKLHSPRYTRIPLDRPSLISLDAPVIQHDGGCVRHRESLASPLCPSSGYRETRGALRDIRPPYIVSYRHAVSLCVNKSNVFVVLSYFFLLIYIEGINNMI